MMPRMALGVTCTNLQCGTRERRTRLLEGLAVLTAGASLAPHIWWFGVPLALLGAYIVRRSRAMADDPDAVTTCSSSGSGNAVTGIAG